MSSSNGKGKFSKQGTPVVHRVIVEVRTDQKIYVVPDGSLNPDEPQHAAIIMDMLCSGAAAFARIRVPKFERKLIQEVKKPGIQLVSG